MKKYLVLLMLLLLPTTALAGSSKLRISVAPLPPRLQTSMKFVEPSGNKILDADETGKLILTLTNNGKGDAFDVQAEVTASKKLAGLAFDGKVAIGTIPAGKTVTREIPLRASENIPTDKVSFEIVFREANGFDPAPLKLSFSTKAFEPPRLVVADMGISSPSGSARVEPMEIVELTARVQNVGHGNARNVSADVQLGSNVFLAGDAVTHWDLGPIASGGFRDVKFMFYTNTRIRNGEAIPITLKLSEARPRFNADHPLQLVMNAPRRSIQEVVVKGEETGNKGDIRLAGGLSVDVDQNIPEGQQAGKYDVAVIIGNRNYASSGSPDVEFAVRDAQVMRDYLVRTLGYARENIIYAENATLSGFNEIFGTERQPKGKLYNYVRKGQSRVFVFYAGHGAPDLATHEAYLVPVDANPEFIATNGYRLQVLYANLAKLPAREMTVVLDACFSGRTEKGALFKNISPLMLTVKDTAIRPQNAVVFTSAALDQVSAWYPEKRHSLFTYYFLKGLQGEADTGNDQTITVAEMEQYLKEKVPYMARRLSGIEQEPSVTGSGAGVLAKLKR